MTKEITEGSYRAALSVREFDAISGAFLFSILGDSAGYLAISVLTYQRTGSAFLSALTFAVAFLPYLFGGTMLAALTDRLGARSLMIGIDLVGATMIAIAAIPGVPVPMLFVALFVIGALAPVRSGASTGVVAEILPGDTFLAGRSVQRIIAQSGQIAGTALGGGLVALFGPRGALLADTLSFLLSAAVIALGVASRPPRAAAGESGTSRPSLIADSLAGMRAVWAFPAVSRLLLLGWALPFVAVAPEGLAAPAVAQSGHEPALVGVWMAAVPLGSVVGDVLLVTAFAPRRRIALSVPLAFLLGLLLLAFGFGPPLVVAIVLLVGIGVASAYSLGLNQTLRDLTPAELRSRMYTLDNTGMMVIQGLGFAGAGLLGQVLPADHAIAVAGVLGLVAVLALTRGRPLPTAQPTARRYRSESISS